MRPKLHMEWIIVSLFLFLNFIQFNSLYVQTCIKRHEYNYLNIINHLIIFLTFNKPDIFFHSSLIRIVKSCMLLFSKYHYFFLKTENER